MMSGESPDIRRIFVETKVVDHISPVMRATKWNFHFTLLDPEAGDIDLEFIFASIIVQKYNMYHIIASLNDATGPACVIRYKDTAMHGMYHMII